MGERTPLALLDGPAAGRMAIGEALHQPGCRPRMRRPRQGRAVGQLDGARGAPRRGRQASTTPCAPWAWSSVPRSACASRSARTPCPCARSCGTRTVSRSASPRPCRSSCPPSLRAPTPAPPSPPGCARDTSRPASSPWTSARAGIAWAAPPWRRSTVSSAPRRPTWTTPPRSAASSRSCSTCTASGQVLAYHDRSDGGLFATASPRCAFAGRCRARRCTSTTSAMRTPPPCSAEELGAVLQVPGEAAETRRARAFTERGVRAVGHRSRPARRPARALPARGTGGARGRPHRLAPRLVRDLVAHGKPCATTRTCAQQEFDALLDADDPGISPVLTFDPGEDVAAPAMLRGSRPRVAILREQGVNGQLEMAPPSTARASDAVDVHMSDVLSGRADLRRLPRARRLRRVLLRRRARRRRRLGPTILFTPRLREAFSAFFEPTRHLLPRRLQRLPDDVAPRTHHPRRRRLAALRAQPQRAVRGARRHPGGAIEATPSIFLSGMEGSRLPVAVAHGEGRAHFGDDRRTGR